MGTWGLLLVAGAVVFADGLTKEIAVRRLAGDCRSLGVLRLVANGRPILARETSPQMLVAVFVAAVACAAAALASAPLGERPLARLGLVVLLAGALGNLRDRVARGAVVDFIAIGWWPVFNLADVAIVAGTALAAVSLA